VVQARIRELRQITAVNGHSPDDEIKATQERVRLTALIAGITTTHDTEEAPAVEAED
jgi:hypothetical protein